MSTVIVPVTTISEIRPHPNADRLEIAEVLGWQVVIPKGVHEKGEKVVYVPPDAVVPQELSDKWGVTNYLSNGRVRCVKLRGEPSFGFVIPAIGGLEKDNLAKELGITKYEPPVRVSAGDAEVDNDLFPKYTEIENLRNFPDILVDGEDVVVTEKIHGTNCRVGIVDGQYMAGSHKLRRKEPEDYAKNTYWYPLSLGGVRGLVDLLGMAGDFVHKQVVIYGEVYGRGIQTLQYGLSGIDFRAFDIMVDGRYLDSDEFRHLCSEWGVGMVPLLYHGKYSIDKIKELSIGNTTLGGDHIREGVVVKPLRERTDPKTGRVILKYLSDEYLLQQHSGKHSDFTDV